MNDYRFECLHDFGEFQSIRNDWDEFTHCYFPANYSRTHAWLSAWWTTYHHGRPALIYLQRRIPDGRIVAAAPLFIRKELYGGLPILSLQLLGEGLGADDFLVSPDARDFVAQVFDDLVNVRRWHVAKLRRLQSPQFCAEVERAANNLSCAMEFAETDDYFIEFPDSFETYLQGRTRKFRRNFNQATNRIGKEGVVTVEVLDPISDAERVIGLGREVAATSWQFQAGKSHFNEFGADCLYGNLARLGRGAGGEEFTVMLVNGRPAAYLLGCRRGRSYFAVDTAFHADYRHVSVGRLLFGRIIERLIGLGDVDDFDFEGSGEYKDDYATHSRKAAFLTVYNRNLYSRGIRSLRNSRWYATLRERYARMRSGGERPPAETGQAKGD